MLDKAKENRVVADNLLNARSSRSHSLFRILIKASHSELTNGVEYEGAINLIDLAGSERLHKIGNSDKRVLEESKAINLSLSCLRDVIKALANNGPHIPYRNSKLTYLLQPHLSSESAKTLMLVNASPLACHMQETINSLRFASEVNSCILTSKHKY